MRNGNLEDYRIALIQQTIMWKMIKEEWFRTSKPYAFYKQARGICLRYLLVLYLTTQYGFYTNVIVGVIIRNNNDLLMRKRTTADIARVDRTQSLAHLLYGGSYASLPGS